MKEGPQKGELYYTGLPWMRLVRKEDGKMDMWTLFNAEQKEMLLRNGQIENHGKNHHPVAYLRVRQLGYSFLITEVDPEEPEFAYGLCDYDTKLKIEYVNLNLLSRQAEKANDTIISKKDFYGKYPLAVYAAVAKELHTISTDYSKTAFEEEFKLSAEEENLNTSTPLDFFKSKLRLF